MWDECLCGKDSDGDGRSNGQELGDPECVWTPEKIPATTKNITHPGKLSSPVHSLQMEIIMCGNKSLIR